MDIRKRLKTAPPMTAESFEKALGGVKRRLSDLDGRRVKVRPGFWERLFGRG